MGGRRIGRRTLLQAAGGAAAAHIVARHVLGGPGKTAPSDKLGVACVGCGGKGHSDTIGMGGEQIVGLCDIDAHRLGRMGKRFPQAKQFADYREMLARLGEKIDAVTVSTPDHHHAPASMMALKMGKHVFCQKPLTHSVYEARQLAREARKQKVATIMGIQGHCSEHTRVLVEWLRAGVIGTVKEIHYWTNRPIWPQGHTRPKGTDPVPEHIRWDLWLGPAPDRPFKAKYTQGRFKGQNVYLPFVWRGWWDFGTGALGDIGCHAMAAAFWALDIGSPNRIEVQTSPRHEETAPDWSIVTYHLPASDKKPALKIVWYDGGKKPPRPKELEDERPLGKNGNLIVGTDGVMFNGRVIPDKRMKDLAADPPAKTLPRSPGIYAEFIRACKGGAPTVADFVFSGHLSEVVLAGNLAVRTGKTIEWDGPAMRCTNVPEANALVRRTYRKGWSL